MPCQDCEVNAERAEHFESKWFDAAGDRDEYKRERDQLIAAYNRARTFASNRELSAKMGTLWVLEPLKAVVDEIKEIEKLNSNKGGK